MAYDEGLADRVRRQLDAQHGAFEEKKMFGGVCFLVGGNMACGIVRDTLMVRVGKDAYDDALSQPHAREMDFTGRVLRGLVYVDPEGLDDEDALDDWVARGLAFAGSLPKKR